MKLEPIIGLEIHVQLKTASKMFCGCSNRGEFEPPNTTVCPVCLGLPGTLPVPNRKAVDYAVLAGLALGGKVTDGSKFDRKNYFYPDLPKGYQISQFDQPVVQGGELTVPGARSSRNPAGGGISGIPDNEPRDLKVRLVRIHLEEDAAKLHHGGGDASLVDFNRAGTPLIETVTEPDLRSPAEAKAFLQELRLVMRYLGVSDADMEKGHLRCDANISLREVPDHPADENWTARLNPKTEVKNINSFRSVERALDYEIKRQTKLWLDGKPPMIQSTRGWDDERGVTVEQRIKEEASDYRYFPEPDVPLLALHEIVDALAGRVPELPAARRARLAAEYGFGEDESATLVDDKDLADFAEQVMSELKEWATSAATPADKAAWDGNPEKFTRLASGWILTKLNGVMAEHKISIRTLKITPENFAELLALVHQGRLTGPNGLVVLEEMAETGADPSVIMKEKELEALTDTDELERVAGNVVVANPKAVEDWKAGKANAVQFLVGQMMKATRGKAPPELARDLIEKVLKK